MKIAEVEVGKTYAYVPESWNTKSPEWMARRHFEDRSGYQVEVIAIETVKETGTRWSPDRNVRYPKVRFVKTGEEMHVSQRDIIGPWDFWLERATADRDARAFLDTMENEVHVHLARLMEPITEPGDRPFRVNTRVHGLRAEPTLSISIEGEAPIRLLAAALLSGLQAMRP